MSIEVLFYFIVPRAYVRCCLEKNWRYGRCDDTSVRKLNGFAQANMRVRNN